MKKYKQIVIATHGSLAEGMISALEIIVGETNIKTISAYLSEDFNLSKEIEELMNHQDFEREDLIICTDLMGGSVTNEFTKYLSKYKFHLITNINLAFLIDLYLSIKEDFELHDKVHNGFVNVTYVNEIISDHIKNDFDDL